MESDTTKEVWGIPGLLPQVQDKKSDDRHALIPGKTGASRRFERVWGSLQEQVYPLGDGTPPLAINVLEAPSDRSHFERRVSRSVDTEFLSFWL